MPPRGGMEMGEMATGREVSGGCLCGAVRFSAVAGKSDVGVCHCTMCQRWSAGPFLALDCDAATLKVSDADALGVYASSEWGERCFCKTCGSSLMWRSRDGRHLVVSAGALDDTEMLRLASQIFIDQKPAYYAFANETIKMTGPEFIALMTGGDKKD